MNRLLLLQQQQILKTFVSHYFKRNFTTSIMSSYKLVCLGNPLLDLQAKVEKD